MGRVPNFLYLGTSKAGSTWLYNLLDRHPDTFMVPNKGLYFFCHHFDQGMDWYLEHFRDAGDALIVGEISHSYLYSADACKRIAELGPDTKLMVCLREPVDRAFSAYLDGVKNGKYSGTFEEELERSREILERGMYAKYLTPWVERFGRQRLHAGVFDELGEDPERFAGRVFEFLGLSPIPLTPRELGRMMPAALPRLKPVMKLAKKGSRLLEQLGFRRLRGRFKTSRYIRHLLYRPYTEQNRPVMQPATRQALQELFRPEILRLDELLGTSFADRWGDGSAVRPPDAPITAAG